MEQSITLKPSELNVNLFEALRKYFSASNASEVTISFKTPDTVDFLRKETKEEANKRIEAAAKYFENDNVGISFTGEEFNELAAALPKLK